MSTASRRPRVLTAALGSAVLGVSTGVDKERVRLALKDNPLGQGAAGNREIEEGFEEFNEDQHLKNNQAPTKAEAEEIANTIIIPAVQKEIDELHALGAPEGEEERVEEILDAAGEALEEGEEDPAGLVSGGGDFFAGVNKMANEYGLTVCGAES